MENVTKFANSKRENLKMIAIDANASWTADFALTCLTNIFTKEEFTDKIYMLEQPFPVNISLLSDDEKDQWENVNRKYNEKGIIVFADESIRDYRDLPSLERFIGGVNIKLEKTGGIRNAIRTISQSLAQNLQVWIGTMVGSSLNCNIAAALLSFATVGGDLDGVLLVDDPAHFTGSFQWIGDGRIEFPSAGLMKGIGFTKIIKE